MSAMARREASWDLDTDCHRIIGAAAGVEGIGSVDSAREIGSGARARGEVLGTFVLPRLVGLQAETLSFPSASYLRLWLPSA